MRNSRADVIDAAMRVLAAQGLENCSMRRVAGELGVQPSALYHHVPNKQSLLALMADKIVAGVGVRTVGGAASASGLDAASQHPAVAARALCLDLRAAMLAVTDGADVVATASAFQLGASRVENLLASLVGRDGARTLLIYTFGHTQATQTHRKAAMFGALIEGESGGVAATEGALGGAVGAKGSPAAGDGLDQQYERGLDIILNGLG